MTGDIEFGYTRLRQIFTDEEEMEISKYLKESSDIYFGLMPKEVRRLALDYAKAILKNVPKQWLELETAGKLMETISTYTNFSFPSTRSFATIFFHFIFMTSASFSFDRSRLVFFIYAPSQRPFKSDSRSH